MYVVLSVARRHRRTYVHQEQLSEAFWFEEYGGGEGPIRSLELSWYSTLAFPPRKEDGTRGALCSPMRDGSKLYV